MRYLLVPLFLFSMAGCIGTDIIDDPIVPERLTILPRIDSIEVGEEIRFFVEYFNMFGIPENKTVEWISTDPSVVSIDQNGLAKALAGGPVNIIARTSSVSDTLVLNSGGGSEIRQRTGTFQRKTGSYDARGTAVLEQRDGKLKILLQNDFSTTPGPSLYLLLANHTNGNYSITRGGQAINAVSAQITPDRMTRFSGAMEFDVPENISITDYQHVVLYCSLGPVFGFATLSN